MRYGKGTIQISDTRDIPMLRQVLRSGFVTGDQLFEFLKLEQTETSRQAFDHRLRRLVDHGLIEKHPGAARGSMQVYAIGSDGAALLIDMGELFAGRNGVDGGKRDCTHWLDLNHVHLALLKTGALTRWIPASEICSQNDLTQFAYAKDYDAVVVVECQGADVRFAIEYERMPKTHNRYERIVEALEREQLLNTVLYLVPNYHLLCMIRDRVVPRRLQVCVAAFTEFVKTLLATPVMIAGTDRRDVPFEIALLEARARRSQR